MTWPVLPREVFDEIISQLTDNETLKSCSLVCRSVRHSAQKILFDSISVALVNAVNTGDGPREPINLVLIVEQAPHLVEHIQELQIFGNSICRPLDVDGNATNLANALGIFFRKGGLFSIKLRSLRLASLSWHFMTPGLKDALVLLMTVHSLRDITLHDLINCPIQNLPPLLKHLSLKDTTFLSLQTNRNKLPKLESLTMRTRYLLTGTCSGLDQFPGDAMERIVDMSQLKTFQGDKCDAYTMPVIERILRPTSNFLEHLILQQLYIEDPDSISFDLNQFPQLTDITISHFCYVPDTRPLALIPPTIIWTIKTIKNISHRNVIQNLSFQLEFGQVIHILDFDSVMKSIWQEVDTICSIPQLASSKSFRGITFSIRSTAPNCDAFSDLVRNKLPETKKASKLHIKTSPFR